MTLIHRTGLLGLITDYLLNWWWWAWEDERLPVAQDRLIDFLESWSPERIFENFFHIQLISPFYKSGETRTNTSRNEPDMTLKRSEKAFKWCSNISKRPKTTLKELGAWPTELTAIISKLALPADFAVGPGWQESTLPSLIWPCLPLDKYEGIAELISWTWLRGNSQGSLPNHRSRWCRWCIGMGCLHRIGCLSSFLNRGLRRAGPCSSYWGLFLYISTRLASSPSCIERPAGWARLDLMEVPGINWTPHREASISVSKWSLISCSKFE